MTNTPYDYQEKIAQQILSSGDISVALFMDMGTGKTITSLRVFELLHEQKKANKILVVCLKNKIEDWKEEIEMEFQDIDFNY